MIEYKISATSIITDFDGINELMMFYVFASNYNDVKITLNFTDTEHIDANLSALLLSIIEKLLIDKRIHVIVLLGDKEDVFIRNGFLSMLPFRSGHYNIIDERKSTIALKKFDSKDDDSFCEYLSGDFLGHRGLNILPDEVKCLIRSHYTEIFCNVNLHADTYFPVYTCGQFFPTLRVLKFTLVDLGVGFLNKIHKKTDGEICDSCKAIMWATEDLNTTKDLEEFGPGGTGLKQIKKYCEENNGSLHIVSGNGYVQIGNYEPKIKILNGEFPGSLINIIITNL